MSSLLLDSPALQALSVELADIAQRYHRYSGARLILRQYTSREAGVESIYVVGEDDQGKEWIAVKVGLRTPTALSLAIDLQHTNTKPLDTHQNNKPRPVH
jgi:hypothetical protein